MLQEPRGVRERRFVHTVHQAASMRSSMAASHSMAEAFKRVKTNSRRIQTKCEVMPNYELKEEETCGVCGKRVQSYIYSNPGNEAPVKIDEHVVQILATGVLTAFPIGRPIRPDIQSKIDAGEARVEHRRLVLPRSGVSNPT